MKKKLFFFASLLTAAAATLGLTSCSNEMTPDQPIREGMVDVVMTTSMPQELQSYGVSSAEGGLKNLEDKGYSVRYIMEVYPKGSTTKVQRMIKYVPMSEGGSYRTTSFETRLLASEYNFVFFADIVRQVNAYPYNDPNPYPGLNKPYYANRYFFSNTDESSDVLIRPTDVNTAVAGDLQTICASIAATDTFQNPYLEMYDAYSCSEAVDLRIEPTTQSFTLKRPFAKLRLITTDADKLLTTPDWSKSRVDITVSDIPTGFNALTGASVNVADRGYWNGGIQALNSDLYSNENEKASEKTISVFYLPVPANGQNLTFKMDIKDASGNYLAQRVSLEVQNVPLVGNKLTTIKGNLLSKNATFNVTIDDEFEKDDEGNIIDNEIFVGEVSSEQELKAALTGGSDVITYSGKVTKEQGFELDFTNLERTAPIYKEGNDATLSLTLSNVEEGAVITVKGNANSPKVLQLNTNTKCSVRMDFPSTTTVALNGESFKYLVYNCPMTRKVKPSVDALFCVSSKANWFLPSNRTTFHRIALNEDFSLNAEACANANSHENKECNFFGNLQTWLNSNSGKTVWDFVGDANN
jgi:hypothetical protein